MFWRRWDGSFSMGQNWSDNPTLSKAFALSFMYGPHEKFGNIENVKLAHCLKNRRSMAIPICLFLGSPKQHLEFTKLVEVVETEGLKMLKNVKTRWISLLEPLQCVLGEYKALIVKKAKDNSSNATTRSNLGLLLDL